MNRISVVLFRSIYPRNIGMCARAMANMGVSRLVLVTPQCELSVEAQEGATSAQAILQNITIYKTIDEFYKNEGEGLRIALSARGGKLRDPKRLDLQLEKLATSENSRLADASDPIYFYFGPEDDGLNDEEIQHAHHVCALPTFGDFFSMNISHAVMLTLYAVRTCLRQHGFDTSPEGPIMRRPTHTEDAPDTAVYSQRPAPKLFPDQSIDRWIETLGFQIDNRRANASRTLKKILLENAPTHDELRVLEAIIQQTVRKLGDANSKT